MIDFAFLAAWRDLGQLGVTICAGCAAQLSGTPRADDSGRLYHLACFHRCPTCQAMMQRDHYQGDFRCRDQTCVANARWFQDWIATWGSIAYQWEYTDRVRISREATARAIAINQADKALLEQIDMAVATQAAKGLRYAPTSPSVERWWRLVTNCMGGYGRAYMLETAHYPKRRRVMILAWGKLQEEHAKSIRRWRRLAHTMGAMGKRFASQKQRLLNPNYSHEDDGASKRFAQLEID